MKSLNYFFPLPAISVLVIFAATVGFSSAQSLEEDMAIVDQFLEKAEHIDDYMTGDMPNLGDDTYPNTPKALGKAFCQAFIKKDDQALFSYIDPNFLPVFKPGFEEKKKEKNYPKEIAEWKAFGCRIAKVEDDLETGGTVITYPNKEKILVVKEKGRYVFTLEEPYRERMFAAMPPYPETSSGVAEAVCRTFREKNWPEFLSYMDLAYIKTAKQMIQKLKKDEDFGMKNCHIQDSREMKDGVVRYQFGGLGNVDLKLINGDWYVVKF